MPAPKALRRMNNPKRPCGHTRIKAGCEDCAARLIEALHWCMANPAPRGVAGPQPVGRIMQEQIERFEEAI